MGSRGCSKVPDADMLSFSITARDLVFPTAVNDTISSSPIAPNPIRRAPCAASVANPLPQCSTESRQPISTQGENGNSAVGTCRPTKPMNWCEAFNSAAQNPQPRSLINVAQRSASKSLSARLSGAGKNAMALASALIAAKASRSAGFHCRKTRRFVSNSMRSATGKYFGE